MVERLASLTLLAFILVSMFLPLAASDQERLYVIGDVVLHVPAVSFAPNGSMVGVPSILEVRGVYPGEGDVYFSTRPLTEIDTQAAARIAALIASLYAGVDPFSVDWLVKLEAESPMVGGPSASAATALAMYAVLTGRRVPSNISLTGMINVDGSIGPVGGILAKLEAMAKLGVKTFYVPAGEVLVPVVQRSVERRGSWVIEREVTRWVNVTQVGEKLGVRVVPVASFAQLIHDVFGVKLPKVKPRLPPELESYLRDVAERYLREARGNYTEAVSLYQRVARALPPSLADVISSRLAHVEKLMEDARRALREGVYYTAASSAFAAAIQATTVNVLLRSLGGSTSILRAYIDAAHEILLDVNTSLSKLIEKRDLNALQVAIGVYERLMEAHDALTSAIVAERRGDIATAVTEAVYAYYRARSASDWASTYSLTGPGPVYDPHRLRETVSTFTGFAEMLVAYMQRLGVINDYLSAAQQALTRLRSLVALHAPYENRLAVAIDAIVYSTLALHEEFHTARILYNASRETALYAYAMVSEKGVDPILPASYIEAGDAASKPEDKIAYYVKASTMLLVLYAMAYAGVKPAPTAVQHNSVDMQQNNATGTAATPPATPSHPLHAWSTTAAEVHSQGGVRIWAAVGITLIAVGVAAAAVASRRVRV